MAGYNISTGYKPEFALGALYEGENAAYNEAMQDQTWMEKALANIKTMHTAPQDVLKGEWEAAQAQDKLNNPDYRKWAMDGYIGQMKSQDAAGRTAQALQPFKQKAEERALENDLNKQNLFYTMTDIDSKLRDGGSKDTEGNIVPFTPEESQYLQKQRQQIIQDLANTPEFYQKRMLQDDKLESAEYIAAMRASAAKKALNEPKYKEQLAAAISILSNPSSTPEQRAQASKWIEYDAYLRQMSNPGSYKQDLDLGAYGVNTKPPPISQGPAAQPKPNDGSPKPQGQTIRYDNQGNRINE